MSVILVHGGASNNIDNYMDKRLEGVKNASKIGYQLLSKGMNAIDAVEAAVKYMEDDPIFNAGLGSSVTLSGKVQMQAVIIDGKTLSAGAVAGITSVKNPINLARKVMTHTPHCFLIGPDAEKFALTQNIDLIDPKSMIHPFSIERLKNNSGYKNFHKNSDHDTVGAVALDIHGNIAAATSTGGITGQMDGRVGDSPIIGSGAWADNCNAAISTTGHGESIMKICLAKHAAILIENGIYIQDAVEQTLDLLSKKTNGHAGLISCTKKGDIALTFNTLSMPWAYVKNDVVEYGNDLDTFKKKYCR